MAEEKICKGCGETKWVGEFYMQSNRRHYHGTCKTCMRIAAKIKRAGKKGLINHTPPVEDYPKGTKDPRDRYW